MLSINASITLQTNFKPIDNDRDPEVDFSFVYMDSTDSTKLHPIGLEGWVKLAHLRRRALRAQGTK